jgi:uncharacterized protein DUF5330
VIRAANCAGSWGKPMRFLFRLAFWLGVVLILLPGNGSQTASSVTTGDAFSAAKATVTDVRSFCDRQREACVVGTQAAVAIGHRAQGGAKFLYDFLNERLGSAEPGSPVTSGPMKTGAAAQASRDTLTPADRMPAWRGPRPHKEPRLDRPQ